MLRLRNSKGSTRLSTRPQQNIMRLLLLVVFTGAAMGQVLYGSLTGTVSDSSGAVVSSVKVEATFHYRAHGHRKKQSDLPVTLRLSSDAS